MGLPITLTALAATPFVALALESPPGFVRDLITSRLVAIVLGTTALVCIGLWLAWQVREAREVTESSSASHDGQPPWNE